MFIVQKFCNAKEVCNRGLTYQPALARKSGESILEFGSKIDIDLVIIFLFGTRDGTRNSSSLDPRGPGPFFTPRFPEE